MKLRKSFYRNFYICVGNGSVRLIHSREIPPSF